MTFEESVQGREGAGDWGGGRLRERGGRERARGGGGQRATESGRYG